MTQHRSVRADLLAAVPQLRAFAVSLCGRRAQADDLVQETLLRAWANLASFQPGTNMVAWLFTILRREFYSEFRRRRREVGDSDGLYAARRVAPPTQDTHIEFQEFRAALGRLAPDHREALILVGASGLSYEEAALVCGCALGTMKSRVHRARIRLSELLCHADDSVPGPGTKPAAAAFGPRTVPLAGASPMKSSSPHRQAPEGAALPAD